MRPIRLISCVVCLIAALSSAACGEATNPRVQPTTSLTSADATVGPVGFDETVTVGPFEVAMARVRYVENPEPGPDMPMAMSVPPGYVLAIVELEVVLGDGREADLAPALNLDLVDGNGVSQAGLGVSVGRTRESPEPGIVNWSLYAPLEQGEVFRIASRFLIDPNSESYLLRYWPSGKIDGPAVEFAFR